MPIVLIYKRFTRTHLYLFHRAASITARISEYAMVNVADVLVTWLIATSCVCSVPVQGARILALMVTVSPSHHIWNRSLMLALVARGHHVTVLTPDKEKTPPSSNYTELVIEGAYDYSREDFPFEMTSDNSFVEQVNMVFEYGAVNCRKGIASPAAQRLMKSQSEFDLIIVEVVLEECYLGFLHKFNYPPVIGITAWSSPTWADSILGNPENPSYIPNFLETFTDHMSFTERITNLISTQYVKYYRQWIHLPKMNDMIQNNFGNDVPSVTELEKRIEMILVNQHFGVDYSRPVLPSMVPVAGMHISPQCKPLPSDIKNWLDEAKNGAIFFSLGSNLRSDQLSPAKLSTLLSAFSELPQRVLWKFESDKLEGQPDNVKLGKWLPQNDILCHPNLKLFITHCGLLSTQEAVYRAVPIIGIPFFVDQHVNIAKAVTHGIGEKLDFNTLTKENILDAINKVIKTPSYRSNMERVSRQFRDQPQTPLERAVFWVEYVARHRGAAHLSSAALDLAWYQYLLLDVCAAILLTAIVILILLRLAIKFICRFLCGNKTSEKKKLN